jgi:predicted transcriptional regulator
MSLQNTNRAQVKLIVSLSPGIHLRKLQKLLGASFSTTRYHVENLERDGEIVRSKEGKYDRLYPAGTAEGMKAVYAVLQSKTARKVLGTLAEGEEAELTNSELAARARLPRSTASETVLQLSAVKLVKRSFTVDGRVLYGAQDKEQVVRLLSGFKKSALDIAADGFVDLWEL